MERTLWAWQDRVPLGGVTLVAGQEGSGKTTILADVLARATLGQLHGDLYGEPTGAVYATAEDSWSRTSRMAAAEHKLDKIFFVQIDGLNGGLSIPGDLEALVQRMKATGSRLLALDPLEPTSAQPSTPTGTLPYVKPWLLWPATWTSSGQPVWE